MRTAATFCCLVALLAVSIVPGCASSGATAAQAEVGGDIQMTRITELYERTTAPPQVHRFRRPLRDDRDRALRALAAECDRLVAGLRTEGVTAEALTGPPGEQSDTSADTAPLETALANLATAARADDTRAMRSAHAAARTAYADLPAQQDQPPR